MQALGKRIFPNEVKWRKRTRAICVEATKEFLDHLRKERKGKEKKQREREICVARRCIRVLLPTSTGISNRCR